MGNINNGNTQLIEEQDALLKFINRSTSFSTIRRPFPYRLATIAAVLIFVSEAVIMLLLSSMPPLQASLMVLINAALLTVVLIPPLYIFLIRRLILHISTIDQMDQEIFDIKEYLENVINTAGDAIIHYDESGRIAIWNKAAEKIYGYTKEEILGEPYYYLTVPEYKHDEARGLVRELKKGGRPVNFETERLRKDGSIIWVSITATPLFAENGEYIGNIGVHKDITERKRIEIALRESEERYRSLFENSRDAIGIVARDGRIVESNQAASDLLGYGRNEIMDVNVCDMYVHPESREGYQIEIEEKGAVKDYEVRLRHKDGSEMDCLLTSTLWRGPGGTVLGYQSIIRDITGKKRMEREMIETKEFLENLISNAGVGIVCVNKDGVVNLWNSSMGSIYGYTEDEAMDKHFLDLIVPAEKIEEARELAEFPSSGKVLKEFETQRRRKDGSLAWVSITNSPLRDRCGHWVGNIGIHKDIDERKRTEIALKESEERYRDLFANSRDAIAFPTKEGKFLDVNQSWLDLFGHDREEMLRENVSKVYANPDDRPKLLEEIENRGYVKDYEVKFRRKDGAEMDCLITSSLRRAADGSIIGYESIVRDVTERKRVEAKLLEYQDQLRSLTTELVLTEERERRQIATDLHDSVGQDLAYLKMRLVMLQESLSEAHVKDMDEIIKLLDQTIEETRVLTFSLSPPPLYHLGFEAALELLLEQYKERYGIVCEIQDDGRPKPLDEDLRVHMFRAVRELLLNVAKHAQASSVKVAVGRDDGYIKVRVEDDGVGFDVSKVGSQGSRGDGFGLFSVRERLGYFGGRIEIESEPGKGARVTMMVPLNQGRRS